ncbi:MAG: ribosome silencing factor [Acidobacteriota bacterium]
MNSDEQKILAKVMSVLAEMKAEDPLVLDVHELTAMTDFFILAHGANTRQVQATSRHIQDALSEAYGKKPHHLEGASRGQWILMDYGFFILHLFLEEKRQFYNLEGIWMDAPRLEV